jgi:hypothetical protein
VINVLVFTTVRDTDIRIHAECRLDGNAGYIETSMTIPKEALESTKNVAMERECREAAYRLADVVLTLARGQS